MPLHRFKLLIDGEVIDGRQTCNDLGIRSGDVIDVQVLQLLYHGSYHGSHVLWSRWIEMFTPRRSRMLLASGS